MRLALLATALLSGAWYLVACWAFPFAACPRCAGSGRKYSPAGRAWRDCRRCNGSGRRVRLGRRLWNYWRRERPR